MVLANNIFIVIGLIIDLLKSIFIFPGFSLYFGLWFLLLVSVAMWLLRSLFGLFNFGGGGGDD